jgi:nuclear pore complex protein Nup155
MGGFNPNAISTPQLAPYSPQSNTMLAGGGGEATDYQFSGRHNGLYLYFGRILRPVWLMPLARDVGKPQQPLLDSVVTSEELLTVLGQLNGLKGFVHANIHQNGPSSYQSSEKGRIQVLSEHFWSHLVEMTQLLSLGLFRKLKCKKESLCWP